MSILSTAIKSYLFKIVSQPLLHDSQNKAICGRNLINSRHFYTDCNNYLGKSYINTGICKYCDFLQRGRQYEVLTIYFGTASGCSGMTLHTK